MAYDIDMIRERQDADAQAAYWDDADEVSAEDVSEVIGRGIAALATDAGVRLAIKHRDENEYDASHLITEVICGDCGPAKWAALKTLAEALLVVQIEQICRTDSAIRDSGLTADDCTADAADIEQVAKLLAARFGAVGVLA